MDRLNIEDADFEQPIDSFLKIGKYIGMDMSSVTSSSMYYSHDIDTFRFGTVMFSGKYTKEFKQVKAEQLCNVFDKDEMINRVDVYPSPDGTLDAIIIEINNREEGEKLLEYLGENGQKRFNLWTEESSNKTFILRIEEWSIDKNKMLTINLCIIRSDARVGDKSLVTLFNEYYIP